ncbi:hypothetical protein PG999_012820 [Apiospora kogelbergensis]|uniref:Chromosome segregation ATPase n=1 Tax=Apiospora kogelbergensis TaxID=1337665 RepID=A0AAW0QC19_9PEZI
MANQFPRYQEQRPRLPSRGPSGASSQRTSETDLSSSGYTTGTTSTYAPQQQPQQQAPFPTTRSLADRFSRVPRPAPPVMSSPIDNSYYNFDTDTESGCSGSSELSVSTQATSVASDISVASKDTRAPAQVKHDRPSSTRQGGTSLHSHSTPLPTEEDWQDSAHSTDALGNHPPESQSKPQPKPQSKDLQVSGRRLSPVGNAANGGRDLIHKIEQLENEAQQLHSANSRLSRELADTSERLSYDQKEAERSLKQERMARELAARDLQDQKQRFDEYRSNFDLQRSMLQTAESERDAMRRAGAETRMELVRLTQDLEQRSQLQRDQEELLMRQISAFEKAAVALEMRICTQDQEVQVLTAERDALKMDAENYASEARTLADEKAALVEEKKTFADVHLSLQKENESMKVEQEKLQAHITKVEEQNIDLQNEIENLEQTIGKLQTRIDAFGPEKEELTKRLTDEKDALAKELNHEMDDLERDLHQDMDELEKKLQGEKHAVEERLLAEKEAIERQLLGDKEAVEKQLADEKAEMQTRLEEEKAAIQQQLEAEKADIQKQLDEGIAEKAAQIEVLETTLCGSKDANIVLAEEKLALDRKLTEAREHFAETTENLAKLQTEITAFQASIQTLQADKEQAAKDLEAAREEHTKGLEAAKEEHTKDLEAAKEQHGKDLEAAQGKQAELEEKAKTLEADLAGLDPEQILAKNRELEAAHAQLSEEKAGLEVRIAVLQAELDAKVFALQAEANKVPGLAEEASKVPVLVEQNGYLSGQIETLMRELDEARTINAVVALKAHELELRLKAESKPTRRSAHGSSSRSSSRSSSKDGKESSKDKDSDRRSILSTSSSKKHARSSSSGMVFVRNSGDRAGTICIMRREDVN